MLLHTRNTSNLLNNMQLLAIHEKNEQLLASYFNCFPKKVFNNITDNLRHFK